MFRQPAPRVLHRLSASLIAAENVYYVSWLNRSAVRCDFSIVCFHIISSFLLRQLSAAIKQPATVRPRASGCRSLGLQSFSIFMLQI